MKTKMVNCGACKSKIQVRYPKGTVASVDTCDHCFPINHDGTPRTK
jgi:hypothetical protein